MTPSGHWLERAMQEVQFGFAPYCRAVEDHALLWLAAILLVAGLAWWAQRTADHQAGDPRAANVT